LPETRQFVCAALIPHGNILSDLLREQNTLLREFCAAKSGATLVRFMPFCLFLRENFETAARILDAGKQKNAPIAIMPPVFARGVMVYPVKLDIDLTPVIPPFLERCLQDAPREKNECGFITAFTPASPDGGEVLHFAPAAQYAERPMTVFKLCQIEFRAAGSCAWEWNIFQTKWIKFTHRFPQADCLR
jgi:hypothetical protein